LEFWRCFGTLGYTSNVAAYYLSHGPLDGVALHVNTRNRAVHEAHASTIEHDSHGDQIGFGMRTGLHTKLID
jgi:hypothetical protein